MAAVAVAMVVVMVVVVMMGGGGGGGGGGWVRSVVVVVQVVRIWWMGMPADARAAWGGPVPSYLGLARHVYDKHGWRGFFRGLPGMLSYECSCSCSCGLPALS